MNIVILSSGDCLSLIACKELLNQKHRYKIKGIVYTSFSNYSKYKIFIKAVKSSSFYYLLYYLESFIPKLWKFFGLIKTSWPKCNHIRTCNLSDKKIIDFINNCNPDLIISIRPGLIMKNDFIRQVPIIFNLHNTLLPKHRGIAGVMQSLLSQEKFIGSTIHLINNQDIDSGPVILQKKILASPRKTLFWNTIKLYENASILLVKSINNIDKFKTITQNKNLFYNSWPGKQSRNNFKKLGYKFIKISDLLLYKI